MKILDLRQGSPEWIAHRGRYWCASDAPAMMGTSNKMKREEIVRMKALGLTKEFSDWALENLIARGHKVEAAARDYAEELLGEDLYPVTATDDDGTMLCSFDGLTMAGNIAFEAKLWNEETVVYVRRGEVPPWHSPQLDHQCVIAKLEKVLFVVTDGEDQTIHCWYVPTEASIKALMAGWKQFDADVKNYVHVEVVEPPKGQKTVTGLPFPTIEVEGRLACTDLSGYRLKALAAIAAIPTELKTDQDFADAAENVKACETNEGKLESAKEMVLSRTGSVQEALNLLDEIREAFRKTRLDLNKKVEKRKLEIRAEIIHDGQAALANHIHALNERIGRAFMPPAQADFASALKNKRSIQSMRDAVADTLAAAKIAANEVADRISMNLRAFNTIAKDHATLFPDLATVALKPADDFTALLQVRITEHKQREEEKARQAQPVVAPPGGGMLTTERHTTPPPGLNNVVSLRQPQRPGDRELVLVIASRYQIKEPVALSWLRTMDFDRLAALYTTAKEEVEP